MTDIINRLAEVLRRRQDGDPESSYVARLYAGGLNTILEKLGEEATETILAAKDAESDVDNISLISETADLWFHSMVMLTYLGQSPEDVLKELERRFGTGGLEEKRSRLSSQ